MYIHTMIHLNNKDSFHTHVSKFFDKMQKKSKQLHTKNLVKTHVKISKFYTKNNKKK